MIGFVWHWYVSVRTPIITNSEEIRVCNVVDQIK